MNTRAYQGLGLAGSAYPFKEWEPGGMDAARGLPDEQSDMQTEQVSRTGELLGPVSRIAVEGGERTWQPNGQVKSAGARPYAEHAKTHETEANSMCQQDDEIGGSEATATENHGCKEQGRPLFTEMERKLILEWCPESYTIPTLFGLLIQLAKLTGHKQPGNHVSTERLLLISELVSTDIRVEAFRLLKSAWEIGLLDRHGDIGKNNGTGALWSITDDGRRFICAGVKARLNMRKISGLNDDQICGVLSEEELEDFEIELRERSQEVFKVLGSHPQELAPPAERVYGRPNGGSRSIERAKKTLTRDELVQAIESSALQHARTANGALSSIWCGLVR